MTTLKQISQKSGVSVTQVSRALNGHSDVNEETRKHVLEVAKLLNYRPNITAQKLVSGRSGMVALVSPNFGELSSDTTFIETVTGLSAEFSSRSMQFVLHVPTEEDNAIDVYARLIANGSLDGFVIIEPANDDERIQYLMDREIPFVVHGRAHSTAQYPFFDIDNYGVSYKLTRHLIEKGHREIGFINGCAEFSYSCARLKGFMDALRDSDIQPRDELVRHGVMTEALGMISTVQMFSANSPPPTALVCGNILIANGVFTSARALGLNVPNDLSVAAHDDVLPQYRASAFYPALTVTRSPLKDSWGPLASFLRASIDGKPVETLQKTSGFEFVERNSVAAPNSTTAP